MKEIYISDCPIWHEPFVFHEQRLSQIPAEYLEFTSYKFSLKVLNRRILLITSLFFLVLIEPRKWRLYASDLHGLYCGVFRSKNLNNYSGIRVHFLSKRLIYACCNSRDLNRINLTIHAGDALAITKLRQYLLMKIGDIKVISNYAKGQVDMRLNYRKKIQLIRNSYSGQKIEIKHKLPDQNNTLRLVYFGRFTSKKGLIEFSERALEEGLVNISVDLYGRENGYLKNVLNSSNKAIEYTYKGFVDPNNVVEIMRLYDALVVPSVVSKGFYGAIQLDGIPTVFQEAISCGLPIITNAIGGIEEIVWHGLNGVILDRLATYHEIRSVLAHCKQSNYKGLFKEYFNLLNINYESFNNR